MHILLDTHILLWSFYRPERLSSHARTLIEQSTDSILFSAASLWEIAIKSTLKRDDFQVSPERMLDLMGEAGFVEVPVTSRVAMTVRDLPRHHDDPFDRLLVAQAIAYPAILLTSEKALLSYSDLVRLV